MIRRWLKRLLPERPPLDPMYQPAKVRLFIKPYCSWCHRAIHWLDDHDIQYETLNVIANDNAREEMHRLSGQDLAPVIEVDGQVLADFGPDQLDRFWRRLGKRA